MGTLSKNFDYSELSDISPEKLPTEIKNNAKRLLTLVLQPSRDLIGLPIHINSWYRDPVHNKQIGGATNSQHLYGTAVDLRVDEKTGLELFEFYVKNYGKILGGIGLYFPENKKGAFIHIDIRERINNSITAWYNDSSNQYLSPVSIMQKIFQKYNCPFVG